MLRTTDVAPGGAALRRRLRRHRIAAPLPTVDASASWRQA